VDWRRVYFSRENLCVERRWPSLSLQVANELHRREQGLPQQVESDLRYGKVLNVLPVRSRWRNRPKKPRVSPSIQVSHLFERRKMDEISFTRRRGRKAGRLEDPGHSRVRYDAAEAV